MVFVASARPPTKRTVQEAADALRRLLTAIEAGNIEASLPREVALLRRLQGVLAGWEAALGEEPQSPDHAP